MRNIQDKKGMSIGDMYPAVLTIVLVGIVLGVGLYVLATFHDQIATTVTGGQTSINASTATTTLTESTATNYNVSAITAVNLTGGALTNFTFTGAGVITWGNDIVTNANTMLVNVTTTYITDDNDNPATVITSTVTGLSTFADWIAIIVVVIAAAIVLGIVLTSFGRKRNTI